MKDIDSESLQRTESFYFLAFQQEINNSDDDRNKENGDGVPKVRGFLI